MTHAVNDDALETLFRKARTHRAWRPGEVTPQMLMAIYDLARWGPTTNNTSPGRFVFIVCSTLPLVRWGFSRSLASGETTKTTRIGEVLLVVGPQRARS